MQRIEKSDLYILMVEDDAFDAELNKEQLGLLEEYNCIVNVVDNKENFLFALNSSVVDLVLCDYNLPGYNGLEALDDLMNFNNLIPFIFVTGTMKEEVAADAIKAGAWDYVVKDRLFRLPLAIRGVLRIKEEREVAAVAEEKINSLLMAIEQTSAQIIVSDKNGDIEYVNKQFIETTGFLPEEVIGKNATFISPDDQQWGTNAELFEVIKREEVYKGEILSKKKDGSAYWESISITPIKNSKNEITSFVAVKEDITLRKEMEYRLIEARDNAQRSNKLKEIFLQSMSHEIRTPLNAIVGFSELLNDANELSNETIKYYTSIICSSSKQLLSIVSDILTMASIQTGQEKVRLKPVDINKIFDHLHNIFKPLIKNKEVDLICSKHSKDKPFITNTDETKLEQILTNLLNNAIKFTQKGFVEFKYELSGNNLEFKIKDTGIGIAREHQEYIFERFRQADPNIHIDYGGTGLGLSISKSFAEMLGGNIHLKSYVGKGSEFCLIIPYSPVEKIEEIQKKRASLINSELTILIAEDEFYNYLYLETILKKNKITVLHATNGKDVVEICEKNPKIDVILMDIKMPQMDGIEAFKAIRQFNEQIPVIAQTAYAIENDKRELLSLGFTDYIAKPIKENNLLNLINKAISNKKK